LKYLSKYQDTNNPIILTILISKKKPILNLRKPKSIQLFSVAPKPNDLDNKKKFLTTPSGIKNEINKLRTVPINIPVKITKKINLKFLSIFIY
jgi:hypothetical protein